MEFASQHLVGEPRLYSAAANAPPLKAGENGPAVGRLQYALIDLGYPMPISTKKAGSPDGIFGSETASVVRAFQSTEGLSADGVAGTNTLTRLDSRLVEREVPFRPFEDDADALLGRLKILGMPPPAGLPAWVRWDPSRYRAAVRHQVVTKLQPSRVARAVITTMAGKARIRPGKHARDPSPFWQAGEGTVFYTPGNFIEESRLYASPPQFIGYTADAVLLHELVHAMRTTRHFKDRDREEIRAIPYPPWAGGPASKRHLFFGNRGEFNAIVITNTYLSEMAPGRPTSGITRDRLLLVKDHHVGHAHMPLAAPDYFHKHPPIRHYLGMLWNEQPELCRAIALARAEFNPIRDFKQDT